jgi:predicted esterase
LSQEELQHLALAGQRSADYRRAASAQYWLVTKFKTGQYDLACYLARIGQTDAAFYWLQVAALEEGVDANFAERDEDLDSLRRDERWPEVHRFLVACNDYFASGPFARVAVILPNNYKKDTAIPVILWLHGLGSRPEDFVNDGCQPYADELNVAFVGVSGTFPRGPHRFAWADDPEKDAKRLRDALAAVQDRVKVKQGHVITFGFSQGAQVGLEVAVRHPEEYAGAIVLSPGADLHLEAAKRSPMLAKRAFVISCGAEEAPGNVALAERDALWLRTANALVLYKAYPGVRAHAFPADFDQRFPEWVRFILKPRAE